MQFLEEEILEITEATWNAMLEIEIQRTSIDAVHSEGEESLLGHVNISGAWEGEVFLHTTVALARSVASKIFAIPQESVQAQDQIDAVYELSNIIAGNIKSLLPEPCKLSIPEVERVTEWATDAIEATRVSQLSFESEGQPMTVTLWKRELSNA